MTYPSLRKVSYTPDRAGRPAAVSGVLNNVTTSNASAVKYAEHGALKSANWGSGLSESWTFNNRLQPCAEQLQNGYDSFDRLAHSDETAGAGAVWQQDYFYDRWGDRSVKVGSYIPAGNTTPQTADGSAGSMAAAFPGKNRAAMAGGTVDCGSTNSQYDCVGNPIRHGPQMSTAQILKYDGENRVAEVDSGSAVFAQYYYDGDGRRVRKVADGVDTVYVYSAAGTPTGDPACGPCYLFGDHLGSTRLIAGVDGTVIKRTDYLPFGEELTGVSGRLAENAYVPTVPVGPEPVRQMVTGKERDGGSERQRLLPGLDDLCKLLAWRRTHSRR